MTPLVTVTLTATNACPPWVSAKAMVVVPEPTAVTVKVVPDAGDTVATEAAADMAVNVPL